MDRVGVCGVAGVKEAEVKLVCDGAGYWKVMARRRRHGWLRSRWGEWEPALYAMVRTRSFQVMGYYLFRAVRGTGSTPAVGSAIWFPRRVEDKDRDHVVACLQAYYDAREEARKRSVIVREVPFDVK